MNICVYGAASTEIDEKYIKEVEKLCKQLGERGHNLIYGAGACGLMGAAARGFKAGGAYVAGVAPAFFRDTIVEELYDQCNNIIYTNTMGSRKEIMEMNADAFIVVPGGIGTFDEFFQVLTLKQLKRINKPIALFNISGYYEPIKSLMLMAAKDKFLRADCLELYKSFTEDDTDKLIEYVEAPCEKISDDVELTYGFDKHYK